MLHWRKVSAAVWEAYAEAPTLLLSRRWGIAHYRIVACLSGLLSASMRLDVDCDYLGYPRGPWDVGMFPSLSAAIRACEADAMCER